MATTGVLGTIDSALSNFVLGAVGVVSPPPPPPVVTVSATVGYVPPSMPILQARFARLSPALKLHLTFPREAPPGSDVAAAATNQVYAIPYKHGPRRDGPFAFTLPQHTTPDVYFANPVADPVAPYTPPLYPAISLTDPRSRFPFSPRPQAPYANPSSVVPPSPPGVPPPPPDVVLGPARQTVPSIPRAPAAEDPRVRPHVDKVATLLNDLLRKGYIRQVGRDDFEIVGGGFSLDRAPVATDDRDSGAVVGATYVDRTTQNVYVCVNNSVGSAVWKFIG